MSLLHSNFKWPEQHLENEKNHEDKTDSAFVPAVLAVERLMNEVLSEEAGRGDLSDGGKTNSASGRSPGREE